MDHHHGHTMTGTDLGSMLGAAGALASGLWASVTTDGGSLVFAVIGMAASVAVPWGVAWINRSAAILSRDLTIQGLQQQVRELKDDLRRARESQTGPPR